MKYVYGFLVLLFLGAGLFGFGLLYSEPLQVAWYNAFPKKYEITFEFDNDDVQGKADVRRVESSKKTNVYEVTFSLTDDYDVITVREKEGDLTFNVSSNILTFETDRDITFLVETANRALTVTQNIPEAGIITKVITSRESSRGREYLLNTTVNENYKFLGWYVNDECVGSLPETFYYTVKEPSTIEARYVECKTLTIDLNFKFKEYEIMGQTVKVFPEGAYNQALDLTRRLTPNLDFETFKNNSLNQNITSFKLKYATLDDLTSLGELSPYDDLLFGQVTYVATGEGLENISSTSLNFSSLENYENIQLQWTVPTSEYIPIYSDFSNVPPENLPSESECFEMSFGDFEFFGVEFRTACMIDYSIYVSGLNNFYPMKFINKTEALELASSGSTLSIWLDKNMFSTVEVLTCSDTTVVIESVEFADDPGLNQYILSADVFGQAKVIKANRIA